jgi:ribosomal protein S18 acetylase RimI-like enzyme
MQLEEKMMELRTSRDTDQGFMREMLYEAVYWRPNPNKPSIEAGLADPGVRDALADWGKRAGDTAVIALVDDVPAGAAWYRTYDDENNIRGYIEESIPVIVIAVDKNYRQSGIGVKMLGWLIDHARKTGIEKISLMVSKDNHAIRLYQKCGFQEYEDTGDSLIMLRELK